METIALRKKQGITFNLHWIDFYKYDGIYIKIKQKDCTSMTISNPIIFPVDRKISFQPTKWKWEHFNDGELIEFVILGKPFDSPKVEYIKKFKFKLKLCGKKRQKNTKKEVN